MKWSLQTRISISISRLCSSPTADVWLNPLFTVLFYQLFTLLTFMNNNNLWNFFWKNPASPILSQSGWTKCKLHKTCSPEFPPRQWAVLRARSTVGSRSSVYSVPPGPTRTWWASCPASRVPALKHRASQEPRTCPSVEVSHSQQKTVKSQPPQMNGNEWKQMKIINIILC